MADFNSTPDSTRESSSQSRRESGGPSRRHSKIPTPNAIRGLATYDTSEPSTPTIGNAHDETNFSSPTMEGLSRPFSRLSQSTSSDRGITPDGLRYHHHRPGNDRPVHDRHVNEPDRGRRRVPKARPNSGFLLSNPILDETPSPRDPAKRRSMIPVDSRITKTKGSRNSMGSIPDSKQSNRETLALLESGSRRRNTRSPMDNGGGDRRRSSSGRPASASKIPYPRPGSTPPIQLDIDSTQIVNMALNLSESRRIAQRRNLSNPAPPRLTPVPHDAAVSGLQQHLQQQRRTSRNLSFSKSDISGIQSRRASAGPKVNTNSPLQTSFDSEGSYTYHFSVLTLERARRAKEHMELLAQYRRLLELVPPLKHTNESCTHGLSSDYIHGHHGRSADGRQLGRDYNPLQYIRNRKVRARERKAIDGDAQGFSDVGKVTEWIDQSTATVVNSLPHASPPALPIFLGAHEYPIQSIQNPSPSSGIPIPISSTKSKRPRLDWSTDPADMLADVYWVEQDGNKSLLEDRHYNLLFPRAATASPRPISQDAYDNASGMHSLHSTPASHTHRDIGGGTEFASENKDTANSLRNETDSSLTGTRERAKQKLSELKGYHHRHTSSFHSHRDFLPFRKPSFSDTSESDTDRLRRERSAGSSMTGQAVLEKQMKEFIAREEQKEKHADVRSGPHRPFPQNVPQEAVSDYSSSYPRRGSRMYDSDASEKIANGGLIRSPSPVRSNGPSLEIPGPRPKFSLDMDTSFPPTPDLKADGRESLHMPTIGMDLSPPASRPASPVRNPFSKVKNMFRDHSRDRSLDIPRNGSHERVDSPTEHLDHSTLSPMSAEMVGSPESWRPRSPARKILGRSTDDSSKLHRSKGSVKLGEKDQVGLKGIFKGGARIDGVIRSGVSKVSDFIRKKDQDGDGSTSMSSDDSDAESGDPRKSTSGSRRGSKYDICVAQANRSAPELDKPSPSDPDSVVSPFDASQPTPHRSPRFDMLKPLNTNLASSAPNLAQLSASGDKPACQVPHPAEEYPLQPITTGNQVSTTNKFLMPSDSIVALPPSYQDAVAQSRHWSVSAASKPQRGMYLTKRDVARQRALILSTGIKAMEIARRATEPQPLFPPAPGRSSLGIPWIEMAPFAASAELERKTCPQVELFPETARIFAASVENSCLMLEDKAIAFVQSDMRAFSARFDLLHHRLSADLIVMARRATDDADECSRDLVDGQRLKLNRVMDTIDTMLRRRRRRFRWLRRAGWLAVEWALVGAMWYVWFLVVVARVFLGVGRGATALGRWLLWL